MLVIADTGLKMDADTPKGSYKADIDLMSLGVISYLLGRQGSDVALAFAGKDGIITTPFKAGGVYVEELIHTYGNSVFAEHRTDMDQLIMNELQLFSMRRMVVFVITDILGLKTIKNDTLSRMTEKSDVYFICIDDAFATGGRVYDRIGESYIDRYFAGSRALKRAEKKERSRIMNRFKADALKNRVVLETVANEESVVDTVLNLFERGRSGIFG